MHFKNASIVAASLLAAALPTTAARADDTKLATSVDGTTALGGDIVDLSADGRFVLFVSADPTYVANDTNGAVDLFVKDLQTGAVERVNVATDGTQSSQNETYLAESSISGDGRFVAFTAGAAFDPADNAGWDVYLRDRAAGTTTLVSHLTVADGRFDYSILPKVSRDGSHVVFASTRSSFVSGDTNNLMDIYEWDRATDTFARVSIDASGTQFFLPCTYPWISSDGSIVAFTVVLLRGDVISGYDSYVKEMASGSLERVDVDSTGFAVNDAAVAGLSPDGRFVLFTTGYALVAEDQNGFSDGYVRDRTLATTERVTFGVGFQELPARSTATGMSDDARRIAFVTEADASGDDADGVQDCFVADRDTGATLRVSVGPSDQPSGKRCEGGPLSSDGRTAIFSTWSSAVWPGDVNGQDDVFVRTLSNVPAAWNNYDAGFPGLLGVPGLTLVALPRRSTTVGLAIGNSSGLYNVAFLFVGLSSQSLQTSFGGKLLVDPFTSLSIALTPWDNTFLMTVPTAGDLPGVHIYLQALELDPAAAKGVTFTPGLDLTIGD